MSVVGFLLSAVPSAEECPLVGAIWTEEYAKAESSFCVEVRQVWGPGSLKAVGGFVRS